MRTRISWLALLVTAGMALAPRAARAQDSPGVDFFPSFLLPPRIARGQVDNQGYEVPPYYDSLLAKVIAWGRDRTEAVARMQRALDEFTVVGVTTNIDAHKKILASELFKTGQVTTHLIDTVGIEALSTT